MHLTTAAIASASREVPGPRGHPVLGNTLGFKNDIIGTLMAGFRDYGDIVKFRGVGPLFPIYLFAHPDYAMHALKDNAENYPRTPLVRSKWHMVVGDGLICIEGDLWRSQRKLAQPSFDPKLLQSFDALVADETAAMLERWDGFVDRGESLDISPEDLERLGLSEGEVVRVTSRRGSLEVPVRVDPSLRPGLTFMTLHFQDDVATNLLTIDATDPKSGTAEFKATAIRIEKLEAPVAPVGAG
jgi:formylmethanofuran dehydrogenase subunit D